MKINQEFFNYIKPYLIKLQERIGDDFIIFGSAPLYLLGVVGFRGKINDLDISIKDLSGIRGDFEEVTFQGDKNQKIFKIIIDDMEIDLASAWPGQEEFFKKIFTNPIVVDGFTLANLDVVEEWKNEMFMRYNRGKDKDYLEMIQKYRQGV